jgi:bile acid:Na+ symporter, BASS family
MVETLFKVSLAIFIAGNLLDMGLRLNHQQALRGLKNFRFVGHTVFWGFAVGPAVAYIITRVLPLEYPFAIGLILLGMTPGVPFMPMVVNRVKGDLGYTAAFMLLASLATIIYMPLVVPLLLKGLSVSAWTIAKPLLTVLFLPLLLGMLIHRFSVARAYKLGEVVKKITLVFTFCACVLAVAVYGKGVQGINLSWAIVSLIIFFFVLTTFPYWFGFGLGHDQKIILSIGMSTRNLGASLAPLLSVPLIDERAIIMIGLGLPAMLLFAWISTKWFGQTKSADIVNVVTTTLK